jgi:hypothetical protein
MNFSGDHGGISDLRPHLNDLHVETVVFENSPLLRGEQMETTY